MLNSPKWHLIKTPETNKTTKSPIGLFDPLAVSQWQNLKTEQPNRIKRREICLEMTRNGIITHDKALGSH